MAGQGQGERQPVEMVKVGDLPDWDAFSEVERLFARATIQIARHEAASIYRGRLMEYRVAVALGSGEVEVAPLGVHPIDLRWNGIGIEVKTGGSSFGLEGSGDADVWIFAPTGDDGGQQLYVVASKAEVAAVGQHRTALRIGDAFRRFGPAVKADGLADAVTVACGREATSTSGVSPYEATDHVPRQPALTAWRRAARLHQYEWRESHGWDPGEQPISERRGGGSRLIGSRISGKDGFEHKRNFLTDEVAEAVAHRLAHPERHQMLDERRLHCDLLSSMPMCFNLFGPLWKDRSRAASALARWFPDLCTLTAEVDVRFEWSPGRRDPRYLGDRTAFDAAFEIDGAAVIGIETKYHEAPDVRGSKGPIPARYVEVAEQSGMFAGSVRTDQVWGGPFEQIWRDHLLALSMQLTEGRTARYVLVAPSGNPAWSELAERYSELLSGDVRPTFEYRSLESLLDGAADVLPHGDVFRKRYLPGDEQNPLRSVL